MCLFLKLSLSKYKNISLTNLFPNSVPQILPHWVSHTFIFMFFGFAFVTYTFRHPLNLRTIKDDWEGLSVIVEGLEVVGADWDTESNRLIQLQDTKTINRLHNYASFGRIVFICLQSIFLVLLMIIWIKHIYLHH